MVFGCSKDNQFEEFAKKGVISEILGLSLSPDSLLAQLFDPDHRRFSHCFLPFVNAAMAPSFLRFGNDIPSPAGKTKKTPFASTPFYPYHSHLQDISVGSRRIGFPPDAFELKQDGTGGCIIDSGTVISHIAKTPSSVNPYGKVMTAFQQHYDTFRLQRVKGHKPFELCYKNPSSFQEFPSLTFYFQNADYTVDPKYVNTNDTANGIFCVSILPWQGKTILGAWNQQDMRIIYDLQIRALQFAPETCATNN